MSWNYRPFIIPIFVPHVGCPHDCVFCNQVKITGVKEVVDGQAIKERIETFLLTMEGKESKDIEIAFYGGSFTAIHEETQEIFLKVAYEFIEAGRVNNIRISTRPDAIDVIVLKRLNKYGVTTIELGVQSMDETVLKLSERGHNTIDAEEASNLIKQEGFKLGLQMMIGLPGDTLEKTISTAQKIAALKPDFVRIYPALVIKNTEMEKMYLANDYKPLSLEKAIEWSGNAYVLFGRKNIPVIRIGLQPTAELEDGTTIVAGPYHPSIRQMVDGWVYKSLITSYLSNLSKTFKTLELTVNPKMISALIGIKKQVINELKETFSLDRIIVKENLSLDLNQIEIKIEGIESVKLNRF